MAHSRFEKEWAQKMRRAQDGDQQAYLSLMKELRSFATSYVSRKISQADYVEDVVQDILLSVHHGRHTWNPQRPIMPWVIAIVCNRCSDHLRRHYRYVARYKGDEELDAVLAEFHDPAEDGLDDELGSALASLRLREREVIQMLKVQNLSVKEVAQNLEMTPSNVKVTAHRALKRLRKKLEEARGESR